MADGELFDDRLHDLATLDQPVRRAVYDLLAQRRTWLSRDDIARELGLARSVAAFHLEKLVDAGLVEVRQARLSGRAGPGAGRPAKLYRRGDHELAVSVPERRYDLAGLLLARAVDDAGRTGRSVPDALASAAQDAGRDAAAALPATGTTGSVPSVVSALIAHGYEPRDVDGEIVLNNCPFHTLAEEHRQLVCGMNLQFLSAFLENVPDRPLDARLDYQPGYCCVRLARRASPT
jgi:predicted ArsR family transcriptional regulator